MHKIAKLFYLFCMLLSVISLSNSVSAQVDSVSIAGDGTYTRVTIASHQKLDPESRLGDVMGQPAIDWLSSGLDVSLEAYLSRPTGGITAYTLREDGISFELDRPMMVTRALEVPPTGRETRFRYIIDLSEVSGQRFAQALVRDHQSLEVAAETRSGATMAQAPSIKPLTLGAPRTAALSRGPYTIVIDPGHGGRDPGALSVIGGKEKVIVLKAAKSLAQELDRDPRYKVYLTRDSDVYVEHEDRVSKARDWGADLFISMHADAAGAASIKGASVYTISTRGERRIEGTADRFGWEIPIETTANKEVSGILEDLVKRETKSNSAVFAELLLPELAQAGPLLRNSHRRGNLFVLLAPDIPAVLIEIGFLTNKDDAKRLASPVGRQKSASAIKRAIDGYFDRQELRLASN
ncbi:MAG: N-acetylmuramoyl-L-alanine amidase [Pseudomonadota bacterium]